MGEAVVQLCRVSLKCHVKVETLTRQLGMFGGWERGPGWRYECELPAMDNIKDTRLNEITNRMSREKRRSLSSEAARGLIRS